MVCSSRASDQGLGAFDGSTRIDCVGFGMTIIALEFGIYSIENKSLLDLQRS